MTDPEMNARVSKKMDRPVLVLAALAGGFALTGCVGAFDPEVDAASPIAPRFVALVEANRTYPRWEDFPKATPVPEPVQVAARVNTLRATGGTLAGEVERLEWTLGDAEAFQREVAARIAATPVSPEAVQTTEDIEARAEALRARAAAPPPIDRPRP
ncbi:hypothetical protein [Brevundimonas sp.]|jgi:hypothetical protein|uniref:hypothetical protein n=1 Tax=Brevundimonas sp. TaxID=1871086 RepID=UPI0037848D33